MTNFSTEFLETSHYSQFQGLNATTY